ncbi:MAG TPA: hypothetical protein DDZ79_12255, partial [Aequorivita sp.]|nr:hypothetical protein [Aequorivita sp.]
HLRKGILRGILGLYISYIWGWVGIESTYSQHTVGIQSAYSYNGVANIPKYLLVLFLAGSHSSKVKEEDGRVKDL